MPESLPWTPYWDLKVPEGPRGHLSIPVYLGCLLPNFVQTLYAGSFLAPVDVLLCVLYNQKPNRPQPQLAIYMASVIMGTLALKNGFYAHTHD